MIKSIVFLIYNNVIILITLVVMFNSYFFALLSVLLILGDGRPIAANSDILQYLFGDMHPSTVLGIQFQKAFCLNCDTAFKGVFRHY